MLIHLNFKKVLSVFALTVFMFILAGAVKSFAGCPYDILALCKVDGKWVNCCDHYGYTVNGVPKNNQRGNLNLKVIKPDPVKPVAKNAVVANPAAGRKASSYKTPSSPNGSASIYQMNGMKGTVPMKLTTKMVNGNEVKVMKLATNNLNESITWNAKLECGGGTVINHFEIQTANGFKSVLPGGNHTASSMNKNVEIKPWGLKTVESQCEDALTLGNGSYKEEASIWLQPTTSNLVRFQASCRYSGTNNIKQYSGKVKPKTKVKCMLTNPPYKPET